MNSTLQTEPAVLLNVLLAGATERQLEPKERAPFPNLRLSPGTWINEAHCSSPHFSSPRTVHKFKIAHPADYERAVRLSLGSGRKNA